MELTVHAYDWSVRDLAIPSGGFETTIYAWCLDRESKPHLLRIPFLHVCYFELKPILVSGRSVPWDENRASHLLMKITTLLGDNKPINARFVRKPKLYYFQGKRTFPMIQMVFSSEFSLAAFRKIASRPFHFTGANGKKISVSGQLWEDRQSPVRRLLTERDCRFAQWFRISVVEVPENHKVSTISEFQGDWRTLKSYSAIESKGWVTAPKIFSFDIECYSDNHKAMPKEYAITNVVYMISCVVFRNKTNEREKYLIVMGKVGEIPGTTIIEVETEEQLCFAFANLIRETDPDIVTGFNIFGFDYPYLYFRLGMYLQDWPAMGRLRSKAKTILSEINWKSSAYSRQRYYMMQMEGRVNFDLYTLVRREMKLLRYNLDTVSKQYLGRGKHDISAIEMFNIYEKYCAHPDKFQAEFRSVAEYCIEDSLLVVDLIEKLNVWIWLVEFSSVTGVSVSDLFTRGQQMRCFSLIQHLTSQKGIVIDTITQSRDKYSGAYVSDPIPGLYDYIACIDFNSLYPSIMIAYNMCYTTLIHPSDEKEVLKVLTPDDYWVVEWDETDEETKVEKHFRHLFVKEHIKKGLLPELVAGLIQERTDVRNSMRGEKCQITLDTKEKRQLGLKVVANSTYGFTGARQGRLPIPQIAASVTAMGRKLIHQGNDYLKEKYGMDAVYNDTDSIFFPTQCSNYADAMKRGEELAKEVSDIFPPALNLGLEKVGRMFCIKKKKYAFWPVNRDGTFKNEAEIIHKGTIKARRDNCQWQQNLFYTTLMDCLNRQGLKEMFENISAQVIETYQRKFSWQDFVVVKSLGENYKDKNNCMKIFSEALAARGAPANPGDRLDYIIVQNEGQYLGNKMMLPEHFLQDNEEKKVEIDYDYYIEHFGIKNIEQLYQIAHKEQIEQHEHFHVEFSAKYALQQFLTAFPQYVGLLQYQPTWKATHEHLFEALKARHIGKNRQILHKLFVSRVKRKTSRICLNPVKQQMVLVKAKREHTNELKHISQNGQLSSSEILHYIRHGAPQSE
ncbi:DNA polymerase delta catalytic subunit [Pithovirus sibericum]|uniref:DNA-directed DNA polymerase n=1 Tax=Pithovirus sibericum TaxID=1450746 RepID=W5S4G8_9VIRU|nr:DNA polymerase delta catalytic subunit [Pithovirus sibericum]AHH01616.1 DNA polymerase delta catalytic subunit [Pithovirus sibericum]